MRIEDNVIFDYNSIIFYVHIPKSGGSTIREGLMGYFNHNECLRIGEPYHTHYLNNIYSDNKNEIHLNKIKSLIKSLIRKPYQLLKKKFQLKNKHNLLFRDFYSLKTDELQKIRFISSIQERNNVPQILGKDYLYIMTIRNPLERIQSYYFEARRNKDGKKPYILAAKKYNIDDFIKYMIDQRPFMVCNTYSRCISGSEKFEISRKIIEDKFYLVAPIERINEFSELLTLQFFGKSKKFEKKRIGENNPNENIISDKIKELVISNNQVDIKLKEYVAEKFDKIYNSFNFKN